MEPHIRARGWSLERLFSGAFVFKISSLPALVLLDGETGAVLSNDGRSIVEGDPEGKKFPWAPMPVAGQVTRPGSGGSPLMPVTLFLYLSPPPHSLWGTA